jgi:hypothetical protein
MRHRLWVQAIKSREVDFFIFSSHMRREPLFGKGFVEIFAKVVADLVDPFLSAWQRWLPTM